MRKLLAIACVLLASATLGRGDQGKGEIVLGEVDLSRFPILMTTLSALDPGGRPVPDLDHRALKVLLDGRELQGMARPPEAEESSFHLAKAGPGAAPISLVLALDVSGSMKGAPFDDARGAVERLLADLTPVDRIAFIAFGVKVERQVELTGDRERIRGRLADMTPTGKETVLYDAVCDAVDALSVVPAGRKAVVVLSDGIDDGSRLRPEDCVQRAVRSRVAIYSILVGPPGAQRAARTGLGRVSKLSGGIDFYRDGLPSAREAPRIILRELKSQYVLFFQHPAVGQDGRERRLTIVIQPGSLPIGEARATVGFVVPSRPAGGLPFWVKVVLVGGVVVMVAGGVVWLVRPRRRKLIPAAEQPEPFPAPPPLRTDPLIRAAGPAKTGALGPEARPGSSARKTELLASPLQALSWFVEKEGKRPGQTYRVTSESFVIGRSTQADLLLSDETVSDKHARLRKEADAFVIFDLASTNGLFVNQERVYSRALRDGDEVRVGNTVLVFKEILEGPPGP